MNDISEKEVAENILKMFDSIPGEPDIYKQILLEELFKLLLPSETPILENEV